MKSPEFNSMAFVLGICAGGPLGMLLYQTLHRIGKVKLWPKKKR